MPYLVVEKVWEWLAMRFRRAAPSSLRDGQLPVDVFRIASDQRPAMNVQACEVAQFSSYCSGANLLQLCLFLDLFVLDCVHQEHQCVLFDTGKCCVLLMVK